MSTGSVRNTARFRTDHKTLETLLRQKDISTRVARWYDFFADFPIRFEYIAGPKNVVADAISRIPDTDNGASTLIPSPSIDSSDQGHGKNTSPSRDSSDQGNTNHTSPSRETPDQGHGKNTSPSSDPSDQGNTNHTSPSRETPDQGN